MKPTKSVVLALAASAALALNSSAQTVELPPLTITGTSVDTTVTFDPSRSVYRYEYVIVAPSTNKAAVRYFSIDVKGTVPRPQIDPALRNNVERSETDANRPLKIQPDTAIPVGINAPVPSDVIASVTMDARVMFAGLGGGAADVPPGASRGGFVIESKLPPGRRKLRLEPSQDLWYELQDASEDAGTEFEAEETETSYAVEIDGIGPVEPPTDATLYSGGGQQPAEVNKFLRYSAPIDNRVKLAAGTTKTSVAIYYGATIDPQSFRAALNGVDITSKFHPVPGTAEAVTVPVAGTTKLQLSVEGRKASGGRATDSDTLTFLVP